MFGWGEFGKGAQCSGFNCQILNRIPQLQHTCWEGANDFLSDSFDPIYGAWHHVALTFDPTTGTRTFYLDGAQVASQTYKNSRSFNLNQPFVIGGGILYSSVFKGEMDEVMLFDRTLSQAQIAALSGVADPAGRGTAFGPDGTVRIARDATLAVSGVDQTIKSVVGVGTLALDDAVVTVDETAASTLKTVTGRGTLVKTGAGSLTLESATANGGAIDLKGGTLALGGACTDAAIRSHLVAWWNFDDPANPGRDASGNGLTVGPVQQTDNSIAHDAWDWRNHFLTTGGTAYFDGIDKHYLVLVDSAKHAKIPSGAASFSIALWVKPTSDCAGNGTFIYWGSNPGTAHLCNGFRFNNGTELHHYFWGADGSSSALPSGFKTGDEFTGWHHVALTYDGTTKDRKFYIDGQDWGGAKVVDGINVTAANFMIGYGIGSGFYKGYMDDVMIFDAALTAEQVKAISRGIADAPVSGASLTAAAGTALNVTDGTVGLGDVASEGSTTIAAGAKLVLSGEGRLGALSGAGTLVVASGATLDLTPGATKTIGALTLAEGAALKMAAADAATASALVVADAVQLPATATVKLAVSGETGVTAPLFKAEKGLTGSVEDWTVVLTGGKPSWITSVFVRDDTVYARAHGRGLAIVVR